MAVNFKQKLPHYKKCLDSPSSPLKFRTEEWCIKIHKPGVNSADNFPRVVRWVEDIGAISNMLIVFSPFPLFSINYILFLPPFASVQIRTELKMLYVTF